MKTVKLTLTPARFGNIVRTYRITRMGNAEHVIDRAGKQYRVQDFASPAAVQEWCRDKHMDVTIVTNGED